MKPPIRIAPSILAADFATLGAEIEAVARAGADWIHVDVMDGHFVPNLTIGPLVVEAAKRVATRPLDVHLMIEEPDRYVPDFVNAGAAAVGVIGNRHRAISTSRYWYVHLGRHQRQVFQCPGLCFTQEPITPP